MKQIPILMSTPMVKAIMNTNLEIPVGPIDSTLPFKAMTRRMRGLEELNVCPDDWAKPSFDSVNNQVVFTREHNGAQQVIVRCPYGSMGDLLWVRETHSFYREAILYKADEPHIFKNVKWKPSIHMPKDYARIWLRNTGYKIERVQDITSAESEYEGIKPRKFLGGIDEFRELWISINGWDSWNHNPWVWVVGFQVISKSGKPDMEICEACDETNLVSEMRMDTDEGHWFCGKCANDLMQKK